MSSTRYFHVQHRDRLISPSGNTPQPHPRFTAPHRSIDALMTHNKTMEFPEAVPRLHSQTVMCTSGQF
ncbi:unnamed protein product [Penicillium roqueforti FM164]|uniref:Genomic scaffold, ProqFM164S01 n=1 Tax=Penicillium roqueforti (strain FM164) TaxID=1365484 RepID=W6QCA2_PENRF|nr:unnamed protein product [Penicillium roqueforti FM164]